LAELFQSGVHLFIVRFGAGEILHKLQFYGEMIGHLLGFHIEMKLVIKSLYRHGAFAHHFPAILEVDAAVRKDRLADGGDKELGVLDLFFAQFFRSAPKGVEQLCRAGQKLREMPGNLLLEVDQNLPGFRFGLIKTDREEPINDPSGDLLHLPCDIRHGRTARI
jgi:hypothetical protein